MSKSKNELLNEMSQSNGWEHYFLGILLPFVACCLKTDSVFTVTHENKIVTGVMYLIELAKVPLESNFSFLTLFAYSRTFQESVIYLGNSN